MSEENIIETEQEEVGIDWSKIRTLADIVKYQDKLYDESLPPVHDWVNPNLTPEQAEDAEFWKKYRRGLWLLMSPVGSGKDMIVHSIAYRFREYFGMVPILDHMPRQPFGFYIPWSVPFFVEQLDRMTEMATGKVRIPAEPKKKRGILESEDPEFIEYYRQIKKLKAFKPYTTEDGRWVTSAGEVFLQNAVIVLNEFDTNYMHKRDAAQKPIKREILKFFSRWRHLNCLVIGMGTNAKLVDQRCFDAVTMEASCVTLDPGLDKLLFGVYMQPVRCVAGSTVLQKSENMFRFYIDGNMPREILNGKAWKDVYNTYNATIFEPPKSLRKMQ